MKGAFIGNTVSPAPGSDEDLKRKANNVIARSQFTRLIRTEGPLTVKTDDGEPVELGEYVGVIMCPADNAIIALTRGPTMAALFRCDENGVFDPALPCLCSYGGSGGDPDEEAKSYLAFNDIEIDWPEQVAA